MIVTHKLTKFFDKNLSIDDINIEIKEGDIFGVVGPDGAGKTTLFRLICGILDSDGGEVVINNYSPKEAKEKGLLGYMPQRFSLYGDLTVSENIMFFGSMYKLNKEIIVERANRFLQITGLSDFKNRFASNLSGGMKQKLSLTCALITHPKILILDEPTYGVDPESRKEFWKILYELNDSGITILVSTPYMDEAELCKTIAFIDRGKIIANNSPQHLKNHFPYSIIELISSEKNILFTELDSIIETNVLGSKYRITVKKDKDGLLQIENYLKSNNISFSNLTYIPPSMEDVFINFSKKRNL